MAPKQPVQIKIVKNTVTDDAALLAQSLPKPQSHPECYFPTKPVPNPTWIAKKLNIHYSVYKLNCAATLVRKKHIYDALNLIGNVAKKGGRIVKSVLEAARVNGVRKGFAEERMFVKEIVLGKSLGPKKIDIKARGKYGLIHAPRSTITVVLEERSPADFFKMVVKGETPPTLGHTFRKMLFQNDADFERVKALSHMTTSRGRYYRKVQFRRLVQLIQKQYQSQGVAMRKDKVERNLLEKAAAEFLETRKRNDEQRLLSSKTGRQAHFDKNYKKK